MTDGDALKPNDVIVFGSMAFEHVANISNPFIKIGLATDDEHNDYVPFLIFTQSEYTADNSAVQYLFAKTPINNRRVPFINVSSGNIDQGTIFLDLIVMNT